MAYIIGNSVFVGDSILRILLASSRQPHRIQHQRWSFLAYATQSDSGGYKPDRFYCHCNRVLQGRKYSVESYRRICMPDTCCVLRISEISLTTRIQKGSTNSLILKKPPISKKATLFIPWNNPPSSSFWNLLRGFNKKKRWDRKPVSVLIRHLSSQPTPWHRTGSPHLSVYLVLQVAVPYPLRIAPTASWALASHFHPYLSAVVFCYSWRKVTPTCAFRSAMPYPVRTFLSLSTATNRPTWFHSWLYVSSRAQK